MKWSAGGSQLKLEPRCLFSQAGRKKLFFFASGFRSHALTGRRAGAQIWSQLLIISSFKHSNSKFHYRSGRLDHKQAVVPGSCCTHTSAAHYVPVFHASALLSCGTGRTLLQKYNSHQSQSPRGSRRARVDTTVTSWHSLLLLSCQEITCENSSNNVHVALRLTVQRNLRIFHKSFL